jgi:tRNA (guanine37-N1)-methyltransferase
MFASPLEHSIIRRARERGIVEIVLSNIRDFAKDKYRKVDDRPYGGGAGMVMMPGPVVDCYEHTLELDERRGRTVLLSPQGRRFDQLMAEEFAGEERLVLIAGRYEGFDERIKDLTGAEEVSVGDYVLSGGEPAAIIIIDAVTRLLEGALGDENSAKDESFSEGLLEYPHYTTPREYRGMEVPEVLLSGDHGKIEKWRKQQAVEKTKQQRPDLFKKYENEKNNKNTN